MNICTKEKYAPQTCTIFAVIRMKKLAELESETHNSHCRQLVTDSQDYLFQDQTNNKVNNYDRNQVMYLGVEVVPDRYIVGSKLQQRQNYESIVTNRTPLIFSGFCRFATILLPLVHFMYLDSWFNQARLTQSKNVRNIWFLEMVKSIIAVTKNGLALSLLTNRMCPTRGPFLQGQGSKLPLNYSKWSKFPPKL